MNPALDATGNKAVPANASGISHAQQLTHNRVRLLPTRQGLFYLALTGVMLVSSLNYQNNLGILTSLFFFNCLLLSALQTWRLLRGVSLNISKIEPVFCGTAALANITIAAHGQRNNTHLSIRLDAHKDRTVNLTQGAEQSLHYAIPTARRGEHSIRHIRVSSRYPLGVVQAWINLKTAQRFIVYPDPAQTEKQALKFNQQLRQHANDLNQSDYAGMRSYSPGDPFKLINWKSVASEKGLHVNVFSSNTHTAGWIDWDDYPDMDTEQRLSLMTRSVIEHEKTVSNYGLRLPGTRIKPHCGFSHMKQCLTALACFGTQAGTD